MAHFYRPVCGYGDSFITNAKVDAHMTRKEKGEAAARSLECFYKFPKRHIVGLRTWTIFRQRTEISIPDSSPTPRFGVELKKVTAAMPSLQIEVDINKISTSHKKRKVGDRLVPTPARNARPPAPRQVAPPEAPERAVRQITPPEANERHRRRTPPQHRQPKPSRQQDRPERDERAQASARREETGLQ